MHDILGSGGYGIVRKGLDKKTKMPVAIKTINKENSEFINKLIRQEIEVLLELEHDYIIKLEGAYEDINSVHLVFEYIEGGDLFDIIKESEGGVLSEAEAKRLFLQIIDCLVYLNSKGIIHRDIKPENFLVSEKNGINIKLIDFGFCQKLEENETCNEPLGSIDYMSPEIFNGIPYNYKTDVWSAGVILFNMVTGKQPFYGDTDPEVIENIKNGEPKLDYISR